MKISFDNELTGILPKIADDKLSANMATIAENVSFENNKLSPLKNNDYYTIDGVGSETKTIFNWKYEKFYVHFNLDFSTGADDDIISVRIGDVKHSFERGANITEMQANLRAITSNFEEIYAYTGSGSFDYTLFAYSFISGLEGDSSEEEYENGVDYSEWQKYNEFTQVVQSPIINDQYARLYRTSSDGYLKIKDITGERNLYMEPPLKIEPDQIEEVDIIDLSTSSLLWKNETKSVPCGVPTNLYAREDGAIELTFRFPGLEIESNDTFDDTSPYLALTFQNDGTEKTIGGFTDYASGVPIVSIEPVDISFNSNVISALNVAGVEGEYANTDESSVDVDDVWSAEPAFAVPYSMNSVNGKPRLYVSSSSPIVAGGTYSNGSGETITAGSFINGDWAFNSLIGPPFGQKMFGEAYNIQDSGMTWSGNPTTLAYGSGTLYPSGSGPSAITDPAHTNYSTKRPACNIKVIVNFTIPLPIEQKFFYVQTFLDNIGQESPPSEPTEIISRGSLKAIAVTDLDQTDDTRIVQRRIYRSAVLENGAQWFELITQDDSAVGFFDIKADESLGITLGDYGNPPFGVQFLIVHPSGALIAGKGRTIYASKPYLPYIWSERFRWTVSSDIMGFEIQGNDVVVLTKGYPAIVSGPEPQYFTRETLLINQSCLSSKSIVKLGRSIVYASPDGIVSISGGQAEILTENVFDKITWASYEPQNMRFAVYDEALYVFYKDGCFKFKNGMVSTLNEEIVNYYKDIEEDTLYVLKPGRVERWLKSSINRELTWKSKEFHFEFPQTFGCGQIIAENYDNICLKIYANGVLLLEKSITGREGFRLPIMRPERNWQFEIVAECEVTEFQVATSMYELRTQSE